MECKSVGWAQSYAVNNSIYDKIYKETIAEGVYSKSYDYFPLQTNITFKSSKNLTFPDLKLKTENFLLNKYNLFNLE